MLLHLLVMLHLLVLLMLHLLVLTLFHHHHCHHRIAVIKTNHRRHVIVAVVVTVICEPETETGVFCHRHRAGGHRGGRSDCDRTTIIILTLLLAGRPIAPQLLLWHGIVTVVTAVITPPSSYPRIVIRGRRLH